MRSVMTRFVLGGLMTLGLVSTATVASAAPILIHRYTFDDATFNDSVGAGSIMSGNASNLSGGGYNYTNTDGLQVFNGFDYGTYAGNYTVEIDLSLTDVLGDGSSDIYQKLVDYRNLGSDNGTYVTAGDPGPPSTGFIDGGTTAISNNTQFTLRVTRSNLGEFASYINGTQQVQFFDSGSDPLVFDQGPAFANFMNLFRDDLNDTGVPFTYTDAQGNEAGSGFANEVRIYSGSELDGEVPEPASMLLLGTGLAEVIRRRVKANKAKKQANA